MANLASAIEDSRLGVFNQIISNQFDNIDLSPMMVYLVDVVDSSALYWLSKQFDVDGFKGFDQCTTVAQQRELIKNAIQLHRNIGTIWGIKKACSIIGLPIVAIEENVPVVPGGQNVWCAFRIKVSPNDLGLITSETIPMLKTYIGYYKNARSILTEIYYEISIKEDKLGLNDNLVLLGGDFNNDFSDDFLNS